MEHAGEHAIAEKIGNAARKIEVMSRPHADPDARHHRDGYPAGDWEPDDLGLPPDCPVQVLGMDGDAMHLVDAIGQLATVTNPNQMGQGYIQRLFGDRQNYLYWAWPRHDKDGQVVGWKADKVREVLYTAAARKGVYNSVERVRGLGAWTDDHGELVLHLGDALWIKGELHETGEVGGYFYPRRPKLPRPSEERVDGDMNPGPQLFEVLQTWNWTRPEVDPFLFMGWIGAGFLGGALPWRPSMFLVGDKAVGKSTLQDVVQTVFGGGLVSTPDTSAAGIYQRIKQDSLPVAVDELEAEADNSKVMAVVKLARLAASGGVMLRGGSDHAGTSFQARSTFLFSAINPPPLPPQDLSRLAVISIGKLDSDKSSKPPLLMDATTVGPRLLRRLADGWPQFHVLYEAYREALKSGGHDSRGQDTYGIFLTCAHLMLGDDWLEDNGYPIENLASWGQLLSASSLPEREDARDNWQACLEHLLSARVDVWRNGERHNVGGLLEDLAEDPLRFDLIRRQLANVDLWLADNKKTGCGTCLVVPNKAGGVANLFRETPWGGPGDNGVWSTALRQGPPSVVLQDKTINKYKINGVWRRCTLIALEAYDKLAGNA